MALRTVLEKNETENTEKIICPHCGHEHDDADFFESNLQEDGETMSTTMQCEECEKDFVAIRNTCSCDSSPYTTKQVDCKDKGRKGHEWKLVESEIQTYKFMKVEEDGFYDIVSFRSNEIEKKYLTAGEWARIYLPKEEHKRVDTYGCKRCDASKYEYFDLDGNKIEREKHVHKEDMPIPEDNTGTITYRPNSLNIWMEQVEGCYNIFKPIVSFLKRAGLDIHADPEYSDRKKWGQSFAKRHKTGEWKGLKYAFSQSGRHLQIEFWQDEVIEEGRESQGTDRYSSNPEKRMNYLMKKRMEYMKKIITEFTLRRFDTITLNPDKEDMNAEELIIHDFNKRRYKNAPRIESLKDLESMLLDNLPEYNRKNRDGELLNNGEVRYFRDYNGRLLRGRVYHNINNMWWVLLNSSERRNICVVDLFSYKHGEPRKLHKNSVGEMHIRTIKAILSKASKEQDFERCIKLRDYLARIDGDGERK